MRLRYCQKIGLLVFCASSFVLTGYAQPLETLAQQILDRIYHTTADYRFDKPALSISSAKRDVAYYFPDKNTLTIEETAFDVCRSLGQDSIHALAFIIGHELAHMYQKEMQLHDYTSSFLTYDKNIHARIRTEKQADIQGALGAYLAGYKIQGVIPRLIEGLYTAYGLHGKTLSGYPTLAERQETAKEVSHIIDGLIALWDHAPYLSVISSYTYAARAYEHIGSYYRGSEVLNNLGMTYMLEAINLGDLCLDQYALPIEFNWETRLKKPKVSYGAKDFDFQTYTRRMQLLERARRTFEEALLQDENNTTASLNLACCLIFLKESDSALDLISSRVWPKSYVMKFEIAKGAALNAQNSGNKDKSIQILDGVIKHGDPMEREIAGINKQLMLHGNPGADKKKQECTLTGNLPKNAPSFSGKQTIDLNDDHHTRASYATLRSGERYFEITSSTGGSVVLWYTGFSQPVSVPAPKRASAISLGADTYALHCREASVIQVLNGKGEIAGEVRYDID